ncbi:hypothetical protein PTKIN_Ptkin02bG0032100 [Pterospermum kingtungense]
MEASEILRDLEDEEHSSSESGWTMYIGEYSNQEKGYGNSHNDDESDDSMASDASSGPSHHKIPCSSEQNLGMDQYKHESFKSVATDKFPKQLIRRDQRRNKIGKEKLEVKTISAGSARHVQNRDKTKMTDKLSQEE